jgi:hypothetical protein
VWDEIDVDEVNGLTEGFSEVVGSGDTSCSNAGMSYSVGLSGCSRQSVFHVGYVIMILAHKIRLDPTSA